MMNRTPRTFRLSTRAVGLWLAIAFGFLHAPGAALGQLTIVPTFDNSIKTDPNDAIIEATINTAIQQYRTLFTDPITVDITFQEGGGLGSSSTSIVQISYTAYRAALVTHRTSGNDSTALAFLPVQATSPVDGNTNLWLSLPNARALGLVGPPAGTDSTITLNTSIMNLTRPPGDMTKYDLQSVSEHEMDEALGLGSGLNLPVGFPRLSRPQDLFRYSASGVRSFTTSSSAVSYLSLDGGGTSMVGFNQSGSGDFGDWVSGSGTVRVQDAFGTAGSAPDLGVELINLDGIGYTLSSVPEPGTMLLTVAGIGAVAAARRRARRGTVTTDTPA